MNKLQLNELSEQQIIQRLEQKYNDKLEELVKNKITNQKRDAQGVLELAELQEEIMVKLNQKSYINTICTKICRDFKTRGDLHWYYVYDYLPDKYKNQAQAEKRKRAQEIFDADINPLSGDNRIDFLSNEGNKVPEEMTDAELIEYIKAKEKSLRKDKELATSRGIIIVSRPSEESWNSDIKIWPKISTIEPPKTDEEVIELVDQLSKDVYKDMDGFFEELKRFWCQNKEKVPEWINGIKAFFTIFKWLNDDKYSLDPFAWMDRFSYLEGHGKHAAAVWDKAITVFCAKCSEMIDEDENEYEVMISDPDSPSKWCCPRCKGTKTVLRSMTREQIGDRKDFIVNFAEYILSTIPGFMEMMKWYREWKQPYNTARKSRLRAELSAKA